MSQYIHKAFDRWSWILDTTFKPYLTLISVFFYHFFPISEYFFHRSPTGDGFQREGFGRQSMSEKRKGHIDPRTMETYQSLQRIKGAHKDTSKGIYLSSLKSEENLI